VSICLLATLLLICALICIVDLLGDGGTVKPNPNQIEIGATTVEPCCKYAAEADVSSIINRLIVK
jgi:hypothetical protein